MSISIGDKYAIFGTSNVFEVCGHDDVGSWIISVRKNDTSAESLDGVLISEQTFDDGISTGKLILI